MKNVLFCLLLSACTFATNPNPQLTIVADDNLYERLGYCNQHIPADHGIYYVREHGKCVAKVK